MKPLESWRLLETWHGAPGWNLALDEALLAGGGERPTLRFYTWTPSALSLGYFQRWSDLAPLARGETVVRRFSGGGAIHHADELTFSIAAPLDHPLYRGAVRASYERVHAVLARAFASFGVSAALRGSAPLASDRATSGMCFHRSTPLDLVWDGAKGVGSAQRRTGERVLHHGSIKLGRSPLEEGVACLRQRAPELRAEELARAIRTVFEETLGASFAPDQPSREELEHAARRADFYASDSFVRRR